MNPTPILDYFVLPLTFWLSLFRSFWVFLHFFFLRQRPISNKPLAPALSLFFAAAAAPFCLRSELSSLRLSIQQRQLRSFLSQLSSSFLFLFSNSFLTLFHSTSSWIIISYTIDWQSRILWFTPLTSLAASPFCLPLSRRNNDFSVNSSPNLSSSINHASATTSREQNTNKSTQKSNKMSEADQEWKPSGRPTSFVSPSPSLRSFRNMRS